MAKANLRAVTAPAMATLLAALLAVLACAPATAADKISERNKEKAQAEAARAEARQKLSALKRDIERSETVKNNAADALASSEAAISDANRKLRELAADQAQLQERLNELKSAQSELQIIAERQQQQLAVLLREQHVTGSEDRIKLLLSGDNPNRINRELQYMGYVSQAQAKLLTELRENLLAIQANQNEAQRARDELDKIAAEAKRQRALLEEEKQRRATLLGQISGKLASQRKEAGNIERDEQRLAGLVDRLGKLIEEQRKAEALERERRRKAELLEQEKQRQALAARKMKEAPKTAAVETSKPRAGQQAIKTVDPTPSKPVAKNELPPHNDVQDTMFASLRGRLRMPVKGELSAKFGSKRSDGPTWKGLFIRASEGAEIKAVAAGRVVFAEWLRGFGNLIIVDHGNQYMSIYGNNQAVLKHAGDSVKSGDAIASAGNSGGNEHSGLYFEMRHQGRAIDPLDWVSLK